MRDTELELARIGDYFYLRGQAPPMILVTAGLLADHDRRWMQVDGNEVAFTLANGTWRYRIVSVDEAGTARCAKVSGRCCDMHNQHCESPSELCCRACTEASHTGLFPHSDGTPCVLDDARFEEIVANLADPGGRGE